MSEQQPNQAPSNIKIISFIVILSFVCALILSILSSALQQPQKVARELDRSKQMMIAARILNSETGTFQVLNEEGKYVPAKAKESGFLEPTEEQIIPDNKDIIAVYRKRFQALLVDDKGEVETFKEANINEQDYLQNNHKRGYYRLPEKLIYAILPNVQESSADAKPTGYIIPVNGYGLWDAIYGYMAIKPDGNTVIGISWYDQKETPGLGANISEPDWQSQFPGKHIFQAGPSGQTDFKDAPLGIIVVRGKVSEVFGDSPKSKSAVDGMAGATLTGNGVTKAYKDVLTAYRPFLLKLHNENANTEVGSRLQKGGQRAA